MRTLTATLLCCSLSLRLSAKLLPDAPAPAYAHLVEVNARWLTQASPAGLLPDTAYADEAARIRHHLSAVHEVLTARSPAGLSPKRATARAASLAHLRAYLERGRFPVNAAHPARTPYFVDGDGTHCAVGYLLYRGGATELVDRIRRETNNGYVLTDLVAYPELGDWAADNGFTPEELAWIQPGYAATYLLRPAAFGSGLGLDGGQVTAAVSLRDAIYLGGDFTHVDGVAAAGIARINGESVTSVPDAPTHVTALAAAPGSDDLLYASVDPATGQTTIGVYAAAAEVFRAPLTLGIGDRVFFHAAAGASPMALVGAMRAPTSELAVYALSADGLRFERVAEDYGLAGILYDSHELNGGVVLGGHFSVRDDLGRALDSNFVRYLPESRTFLEDDNYLPSDPYNELPRANLPVLRFGRAESFDLRGTHHASASYIAVGDASDTLYRQRYSYEGGEGDARSGSIGESRSRYDTRFAFASAPDRLRLFFDEGFLISGDVRGSREAAAPSDTTRLIADDGNDLMVSYTQSVPVDGLVHAIARTEAGLLLAGTFDSLAGVPVRHLALAQPEVSDVPAVTAPRVEVRYAAGALLVDVGASLGSEGDLYVYATDGRLLERLALAPGQSAYTLPLSAGNGAVHYALAADGWTAAGTVVVLVD